MADHDLPEDEEDRDGGPGGDDGDEAELTEEPELEAVLEDLDEALVDDDLVDEELVEDDEDEDEDEDESPKPAVADDDDEDLDPSDVEADLDKILRERIAAGDDEEEEEDTSKPESPKGEIAPKRADEWMCEQCFLIVSSTQFGTKDDPRCPSGEDPCESIARALG